MKLVFIEGPGKKDTIAKYLGSDYLICPTKGHVRDLPAKSFAIDFNNNFEPTYEIIPEKKALVADFKKKAKEAEAIYLATDPDREGEAMAWHIATILGLDENAVVRTAFNEISKKAVNESIANPKPLNYNLINAQQGRRVLDRIVGYELSPLLSKKIRSKLSAGRVQSVTLKLVVDRERAIQNFVPVEYWNITANLSKNGEKFKSDLTHYQGKKIEIPNKDSADKVLVDLQDAEFKVESVKRQITYSKPLAPYITSTLQQDAVSKLKMTLNSYTKCAQSLYEGVMVEGEGKTALVTYIRTDSTRVSTDAQFMARDYILENFGKEYHPGKFNEFASKESAQDAHEAIRPINLKYTPEYLKGKIDEQYLKLYTLVFKRFVASQMSYAQYDSLTVDITANDYKFRSGGKALIFDGYTRVYKVQEDEKNGINIPALNEGEIVKKEEILSEQKFTKPPVRFTEASLVKEMEVQGIGRPSTYAATVMTLMNREYVVQEKKALVPTELGMMVTDYLDDYFKDIMDLKFTAEMEKKLDDVELGKYKWQDIVASFYTGFKENMQYASTQMGVSMPKAPPEPSDVKCDKCGSMMVYREGKFGKFLACSNYPTCKNTKNLNEPENKVEDKGLCPKCGGVVSAKYSKRGKLFFGCDNYPKCDYISWDLPLKEKCPKCGEGLFKKFNAKGVATVVCNAKGCTYVQN
ncbi:MAG: type I DNA topoisomerase [Clostridiales bacterium]|nr:type I DNA topoisomerase [Clostridiales bacterium]